jgi:hypothetical protein
MACSSRAGQRDDAAQRQADRDHQQIKRPGEQFQDHEHAGCYQPAHPVSHGGLLHVGL